MKKFILGIVAAAVAIPTVSAPAMAQGYYRDGYYQRDGRYDRYDRRQDRREARRYARYYDNRGYYNGPSWRGNDGRYYCRRSDGTTGLLIGGVAGALVGRSIDTRGDRTGGTVLGAALGALLGSAIEKDSDGRRCR